MNKILIVEDDISISNLIKICLKQHGYLYETAYDGMTAANLIENNFYDLILLDIMLPEINGYDLLGYIKEYNFPVIFLTAKADINDKVKGLRLGADDYITKPFDLQELIARIETVLRRYKKDNRIFTINNIQVDTYSRTVYKDGIEQFLTPKEYELLLLFIRNINITLYRETLYEYVWKEEYYGNTRTVDLHIQRLKKKLGLEKNIKTVYKIGYRFCSGDKI